MWDLDHSHSSSVQEDSQAPALDTKPVPPANRRRVSRVGHRDSGGCHLGSPAGSTNIPGLYPLSWLCFSCVACFRTFPIPFRH